MPESEAREHRHRFTVAVDSLSPGAWHVSVLELPATWTVAFAADDIEKRVVERIALDTGLDPAEVEIVLIPAPALFVERRANWRN
ncbi:MAG: hypothetical protein ACJ77B_07015 [Chloroflexota bacterium]